MCAGINLLEEVLIQRGDARSGDDKPAAKRRRGDAGAAVVTDAAPDAGGGGGGAESWLEVARLYKSLGDYDVLRGILSSRLGTQPLTSRAVDLETRADYLQAAKLYTDVSPRVCRAFAYTCTCTCTRMCTHAYIHVYMLYLRCYNEHTVRNGLHVM